MEESKQIFNIFQKRKKKISESSEIKADYREKNSLVISELKSLNLNVDLCNLKVGDYLINNTIVERKTISDFISSMINNRLLKQIEEMKQYSERLLIIEGFDEQELYSEENAFQKNGMHPNSIRGFLLSISLKHKIPIIFTKNCQDTAKFIYLISKKNIKKSEIPLNANKKTLNKKEQLEFIIESFPGIGPKTARKLLEKFGTLKNIINAEPDQLKEILGKKSDNFLRIILEKY